METETLAAKLGMTTHLSPLLQKARRFGLDAEGLERLAIQRGCDYYHDGTPLPPPSVSGNQFCNEELAIALLNPALRYHPQTLRLGAAMLGAEGNDPAKVARLGKLERCEPLVRYVAAAGLRYEPANRFWADLLSLLPPQPATKIECGSAPDPIHCDDGLHATRSGNGHPMDSTLGTQVFAWIMRR